MTTSVFCCRGLEVLVDNAGSRGIAVLVYKLDEGFVFNIQARAVSKDAESNLQNIPITLPRVDENIAISSNIGLNHCPYCGTRLQSLINSITRKDFEALAEKHRVLDDRPY